MRQTITIETPFIRLADLLKLAGAVDTGGQAKLAVQSGEVLVNGEVCAMRGKKLRSGDVAAYAGREYEVRSTAPEDEAAAAVLHAGS